MSTLPANAARFAALGHPARLGILRCIVQGPEAGLAVGEIQRHLGIPASTLSHHLGTLSANGLVSVTRRGTFLLVRADFVNLRQLTGYLWEDCCAGTAGLTGTASPAPAAAPATGAWRDIEED